jgi:hypothetical protein
MAYEIDFLAVGDGERSGDAIAMRFGNVIKRTVQRLKSTAVFHELHAEANWKWAEDLEGVLSNAKNKKREQR